MKALSQPSSLVPEVVDERIPVNVRQLVDLIKAIGTIDSEEKKLLAATRHAECGSERRATEERKKNDPALKQAIERVEELRAPYTTTLALIGEMEDYLVGRMRTWDREQLQRSRDLQQKVNEQTAKQNDKALAKAQKTGVKPILEATPIIATPEKTVRTDDGLSSSRQTVWVFRIEGVSADEDMKKLLGNDPRLAQISDEYFLLDVAALKKDAKQVRNHPRLRAMGLLIEEDFDYTSRG